MLYFKKLLSFLQRKIGPFLGREFYFGCGALGLGLGPALILQTRKLNHRLQSLASTPSDRQVCPSPTKRRPSRKDIKKINYFLKIELS